MCGTPPTLKHGYCNIFYFLNISMYILMMNNLALSFFDKTFKNFERSTQFS